MDLDTAIIGGTVVTPSGSFAADIGIKGEKITMLATEGMLAADSVIDATGMFVLPGLVDPHAHLDLPWVMDTDGAEEVRSADNYATGTAAAAAGGVTTILDFAMTRPGEQASSAVAEWAARADAAVVDYGFHVILTDWAPEVMEGLGDLLSSGVTSVKVFMPYAIGAPEPAILETLDRVKSMGGRTLIHCEAACAVTWLAQREADSGSRQRRPTIGVVRTWPKQMRSLGRVGWRRSSRRATTTSTCLPGPRSKSSAARRTEESRR